MLEFPLWKKIWLWALTLAFSAAALPSLLGFTNVDIPESAPTVNLGLDLAGGSHLLLEADPDDVRQQRPTDAAPIDSARSPPATARRSAGGGLSGIISGVI